MEALRWFDFKHLKRGGSVPPPSLPSPPKHISPLSSGVLSSWKQIPVPRLLLFLPSHTARRFQRAWTEAAAFLFSYHPNKGRRRKKRDTTCPHVLLSEVTVGWIRADGELAYLFLPL